jgi:hypothetical protein
MSPAVFIIITLVVFGSLMGLLEITKFGAKLKRAGAWILAIIMLIGAVGLVINEIGGGIVSVIRFFANLF